MSRGFVKEDDQEEAPFIPPRAALPANAINYVTPRGMQQLLDEKKQLENERLENSKENDTERRRANMVVDGKIRLLNDRISSARVLGAEDQPHDEVRFGATVALKSQDKSNDLIFTIVGVDEASVKEKRIAFVAPIARAVTGKKVGSTVSVQLGDKVREFELIAINY